MKADIVVGLGFGDEGKGMMVNHLATPDSLVVRYSGGQQAGHTVVHNGLRHVFSNFGAGTLKGAPSFFSEHTCIYPNTIYREAKLLRAKGIIPKLYIHPLAALTTPSDIAYGRVREATLRHGSCGLGIGSTMKRQIESPYKLYAMDFFYPEILKRKIGQIQSYYSALISKFEFPITMNIDEYHEEIRQEYELFDSLSKEPPFELLNYEDIRPLTEHLVFEGSQGILLDMHHGVFPNVTYANTTSKNAFNIVDKTWIEFPEIYYMTRCYLTRHGNGWMPNFETPPDLIIPKEETNQWNEWQGFLKYGELNYELLNYALEADRANIPPYTVLSKNLVVTCMDQRPGFQFDESKIKQQVKFHYNYGPEKKEEKATESIGN